MLATINISTTNEQQVFIEENFSPLKGHESSVVNNLFQESGNFYDVIAIIGLETINRDSLQRLKPVLWLNDELVNSQMHLINLMHFESLKCHCFTSYFMSKLVDESKGYNVENVKRWLRT